MTDMLAAFDRFRMDAMDTEFIPPGVRVSLVPSEEAQPKGPVLNQLLRGLHIASFLWLTGKTTKRAILSVLLRYAPLHVYCGKA